MNASVGTSTVNHSSRSIPKTSRARQQHCHVWDSSCSKQLEIKCDHPSSWQLQEAKNRKSLKFRSSLFRKHSIIGSPFAPRHQAMASSTDIGKDKLSMMIWQRHSHGVFKLKGPWCVQIKSCWSFFFKIRDCGSAVFCTWLTSAEVEEGTIW